MKSLRHTPWLRRLLAAAVLPVILAGLLLIPAQPADAARGGRVGGGSFRAPTMPRSGGGYRGGGSYRGGGGYGGGFGFPFLIPFGFFGGGGLFGLLILMAVAGVVVNALRGDGGQAIGAGGGSMVPPTPRKVNLIQVQLGLLAGAKALQDDLRAMAAAADTASATGLQRVLQETTLAMLRQPDLWVYANLESGEVPFDSAESTFNRLSMSERSKLDAELTTNVSGNRGSSSAQAGSGDADATSEYIVVTLLVASTAKAKLRGADTGEELRESLRILGSTSSSELMALEVIWQPEGRGDVLSADELITAYPNLQHL
ncbi:MAG: DUF1517 domain-containing protein [Synechococcus sp.]